MVDDELKLLVFKEKQQMEKELDEILDEKLKYLFKCSFQRQFYWRLLGDVPPNIMDADQNSEPILLEIKLVHKSSSESEKKSASAKSSQEKNTDVAITDEITQSTSTALKKPTSNLFKKTESLTNSLNEISSNLSNVNPVQSKSTQTDATFLLKMQHTNSTEETTNRIIEEEHNLFEQCLEPEIDIEEITLRKSDSNESLGITVCYSYNNQNGNIGQNSNDENTDVCTEVYISDIQTNSVAGRNGRLRQGDQILQVNGKDVKSKEETELLIAENNNAVTLLVSRYLYTDEDDFNDPLNVVEIEDEEDDDDDDDDDDYDEFYNDNNLSYENCFLARDYMNVVNGLDKMILTKVEQSVEPTNTAECGKDMCTLTNDEKNSSIPCNKDVQKDPGKPILVTDMTSPKLENKRTQKSDIAKNLSEYETEHIYETIPEDSESEPFYCSPYESSTYNLSNPMPKTVNLQLQRKKHRVAQWLGIKSNNALIDNDLMVATDPQKSVLRKSHVHNTINSIGTLCINSSSSGGSAVGARDTTATSGLNEEHDNSSSAYNTGGSNNSATPTTLDLQQVNRNNIQTYNSYGDACKIQCLPLSKEKLSSSRIENYANKNFLDGIRINDGDTFDMHVDQNQFSNKNIDSLNSYKSHPFQKQQNLMTCPHFTAPNLSQYHFVSSQEVSTVGNLKTTVKETADMTKKSSNDDSAMVWKVKRRPDGTRYIVRRPANCQRLLRDRVRFNTERIRHNDLTTTEDDTISEVKIGRYWTKEERKKHIERARERRQQQLIQQQLEANSVPMQLKSFLSTIRITDKTDLQLNRQEKDICQQLPKCFQKQNLLPNKIATNHHYQLQFGTKTVKKFQMMDNASIKNTHTIKPNLLAVNANNIVSQTNANNSDVRDTSPFVPPHQVNQKLANETDSNKVNKAAPQGEMKQNEYRSMYVKIG